MIYGLDKRFHLIIEPPHLTSRHNVKKQAKNEMYFKGRSPLNKYIPRFALVCAVIASALAITLVQLFSISFW